MEFGAPWLELQVICRDSITSSMCLWAGEARSVCLCALQVV